MLATRCPRPLRSARDDRRSEDASPAPRRGPRETLDVEVEPFVLGGQRYESTPRRSRSSSRSRRRRGRPCSTCGFDVHLSGACMRCLGFAGGRARGRRARVPRPDAPAADELHSDYVVDDQLQLSAWARDAVALELPDQILCREDCAGLCPVCGKDLNVEPHEHLERDPDPRWAALRRIEPLSKTGIPLARTPRSQDP